MSMEERCAEFVFKVSECAAYRRLLQAENFGRTPKTAVFGDDLEISEATKFLHN